MRPSSSERDLSPQLAFQAGYVSFRHSLSVWLIGRYLGAQNLYHCEVSMKTGKKKQEQVTKRVECSAPNPEWNDQVKL